MIQPTVIAVGEVWYVKLPGHRIIKEAKVLDVTKCTVLIETQIENSMAAFGFEVPPGKDRYAVDDIKWVEKKE